jgi:hypothetical protein
MGASTQGRSSLLSLISVFIFLTGRYKVPMSHRASLGQESRLGTDKNERERLVKRDRNGNFKCGTITGSVTGNADTATTLETARTIGGVSFNGSANIDLAGVNAAGNQDTTGNAATATTLATARNIGGVSFNGSANIDLAGVNATGNQDTTGNAATATILATARTIGGVSFNGSANIDLAGVNAAGNQNTTGNAASASEIRVTLGSGLAVWYSIPYAVHGTDAMVNISTGDHPLNAKTFDGSGLSTGPMFRPQDNTTRVLNLLIDSALNTTGLASLDGGINVNDDFTVDTDGNVKCATLNETSGYRFVFVKPTDAWFDNDSTAGPGGIHDTDGTVAQYGTEGGLQNISNGNRQFYAFAGPFPVNWRPAKYFFCMTDKENDVVTNDYGDPEIDYKDIVNVSDSDKFVDVLDPAEWNEENWINPTSDRDLWLSTDYANPSTRMLVFKATVEDEHVFHGGYIKIEYAGS